MPVHKVTLDFETRSHLKLPEVGAYRYAEDPSTDVLCLSYKLDDGPSLLWASDVPFGGSREIPEDLAIALEECEEVEAHGAWFERCVWRLIMVARYGWPFIKQSKWRCTMAVSAHKALPLGLDDVGIAAHLKTKKDPRGKYLINTLSKRRKPTKKDPAIWNEDFILYNEFYAYCMVDTDTEHELSNYLGELPPDELDLWRFDHLINSRGVKLDIDGVTAALSMVKKLQNGFEKELQELTEHSVQTGRQNDKMRAWLATVGCDLENLQKETVEFALEDDILPKARRCLELRQHLSKSSTSKLETMLVCRSQVDDRARGLLQYSGAHRTGRWAGRLVQPHNFPRGTLEKGVTMEEVIAAIKTGNPDVVSLYGSPMAVISSSLRGYLIADKGKELAVADFASIEARALMTLAGQEDAVRDFEQGADIYCVMASKIYNRPINKDDNPKERFVGKEAILGLGYQMGKDRFQGELEKKKQPQTIQFCERVVETFRTEYSEVPRLWAGIERAAVGAVIKSGEVRTYNGIAFKVEGDWLACKLPSGRKLWYHRPRVVEARMPWGKMKLQLRYWGFNNKTTSKVWEELSTYGGMLTENIVQAIARDLMVHGMRTLEANGYPVILTVHDEVIAEPDGGFTDIQEFERLMAQKPEWAAKYPVKAEGWVGKRYRK